MRNTEQDNLKYQKLYHWAHTLITSGVIKNMDKFPSETILQKKFGYFRQTVRTALQQLEDEGLITAYAEAERMCLMKAVPRTNRVNGLVCSLVIIPIIYFRRCMMELNLH